MRDQQERRQPSHFIQLQEHRDPYRSLEQSSPLGVLVGLLVVCIECIRRKSRLGRIAFELNRYFSYIAPQQ